MTNCTRIPIEYFCRRRTSLILRSLFKAKHTFRFNFRKQMRCTAVSDSNSTKIDRNQIADLMIFESSYLCAARPRPCMCAHDLI